MKIKLWGTRGSIPTPSTESFHTRRYGGDTTCTSIQYGDKYLILDGGSGLRLLGLHLSELGVNSATFFFTHVHWDHIQGFPFFLPGFKPGNEFTLYGPRLSPEPGLVGSVLEKALRGQQESLTFPVKLKDMPSGMKFRDLDAGQTVELPNSTSSLIVTTASLHHPGGALGYRIEEHAPGTPPKVFAFVTDTEQIEPGQPNPDVQALIHNADLVYYDAQYTPEEYPNRTGWGHSTWQHGILECQQAGARRLLLSHHDPMHDDEFLIQLENTACSEGAKKGIAVECARQFQEIEL